MNRRLPVPGFELTSANSDAWRLTFVPPSMLVIGSGATGVQVASIFHAFGSRVQLFEAGPRVVIVPQGTFRDSKGKQIFLNPFTVPVGGNALAVINIEGRVPLTAALRAVFCGACTPAPPDASSPTREVLWPASQSTRQVERWPWRWQEFERAPSCNRA